MKLIFKQRLFSWFDSYDIYYEDGTTAYTVKGQLSWGHCLKIYDGQGCEAGMVKERIFTMLPRFELYLGQKYAGCIEGDFLEWDYKILDRNGRLAAAVSKEIFHMTDTYVIDVEDQWDALCALMVVLAIDAEKCSRN